MTKAPTIRKRIGLAVVDAMPTNTTVWDTEIKGFCARRQSGDAVSYLLKLRINGRVRWVTIGRHGQPWTPDTARRHARQVLADPSIAEKPVINLELTVANLAAHFISSHGPKLKLGPRTEYQRRFDLDIIPVLGPRLVKDLTRAEISTAFTKWGKNPSAANYSLAVLSKFLSWCEEMGYRPEDTNPCTRIQRFKENKRERFLQPDELGRLGAALDKAERENLVGLYSLAALRLIILTGARLNEILSLQWSFVDLERRILFLPDSKTGKKPIILNDDAIKVLQALPRFANNPYVIVGNRNGAHLKNLQKPWQAVRTLAKLTEVRIHDLRHTFASVAVAAGGSLPVIGRQLGHSQPTTTQRYAHLADDPVRKLTQATGAVLAAGLRGKSETGATATTVAEPSFADLYTEPGHEPHKA